MDENNKLSLKRVEVSLTKFNEVAIPHHLDLLRQHKANILKYEETGEYKRVRAEQTHARRVASQLRALLSELESLRRQVRPEDLPRFDKLTQRSRDLTLRAIVDYLGTIERSCRALGASAQAQLLETTPLSINRVPRKEDSSCPTGSVISTDSVGVVAQGLEADGSDERALPFDEPLVQLQINQHEVTLKEREEVLKGWSELQQEVRALHDAWHTMHAAAVEQRRLVSVLCCFCEQVLKGWSELQQEVRALHDAWHTMHAAAVEQRRLVTQSETSTEIAAVNVQAAREELKIAERLWSGGGAWSVGGAALGALAGGPVGFAVGAKAGAGVALAGSVIGYLGARILGRNRAKQLTADDKGTHGGPEIDDHSKVD